jgi:uncharacterized protein (TIGR03067 family)
MLHRIITAAFVGMVAFALVADAQEAKDDKAIHGKWSATKDGKTISFTYDKGKFKVEIEDKLIEGTYVGDGTKTPKHVDMTITGGTDDIAVKYTGKTSKAIYQIDGDSMKLLAPEPGSDDRPTAFPQEGEQTRHMFVTLTRAKK